MDIQRIIAYTALFIVGLMLWKEWQQEEISSHQGSIPVVAREFNADRMVASQAAPVVSKAPKAAQLSSEPVINASTSVPLERLVVIENDVLRLKLDKRDGQIVSSELLKYPKSGPDDSQKIRLFNDDASTYYAAQTGIVGDWGIPERVDYQTDRNSYTLVGGQNVVSAKLTYQNAEGLIVTRTYTLRRGQYVLDLQTAIYNQSGKAWQGKLFYQILRKPKESQSSWLMMASYVGASMSDPTNKRYRKISFDDIRTKPIEQEVEKGWVAMQEHYFLSAWIPKGSQLHTFYTHRDGQDLCAIGMASKAHALQPQQTFEDEFTLYVGPQISENLEEAAPYLDLTIDYGWLWFVSTFLLWLLKQVNHVIQNWGWSIVIVTLLIKLAFYQLSASSYRSMAGLRSLQPKIQALKERYGDDKQKFSQAMMEIYKNEKINPLGGCLPMIIQIPVFIALYWVLLESVELRHAPFVGWIHDLSARDPYYVLPLLMGLSMLAQQKLSPPPPDPMQAKMMMFLPFLFTFLFLQFPSGLVLYWVVNNVLSILQQWYITQRFDKAALKKA